MGSTRTQHVPARNTRLARVCLIAAIVIATILAKQVQAGFLFPENSQHPSQTSQAASSQRSRSHWLLPAPSGPKKTDPLQLADSLLAQQDQPVAEMQQAAPVVSHSGSQASRNGAKLPNLGATRLAAQPRVARYPGSYGLEAMVNLSDWRATLFKRTLDYITQQQMAQKALGHDLNSTLLARSLHKESMQLWEPFLSCPQDMPLERVPNMDDKDAAKWMCSLRHAQAPCVIYSLGSNNDFSFEDRMLETTPCSVHTFDCTVWGRQHYHRSYFHKICIGKAPENAPDKSVYMSLADVQAMLGHSRVTIMKVDIEGFEYDALQEWKDTDNLPDQLLLEYHYGMPARDLVKTVDTVGEMSLFMMHLANLGYGVIGAEGNYYGAGCCAELGLLRVETVHPYKAHGRPGPRLREGAFEEYMK